MSASGRHLSLFVLLCLALLGSSRVSAQPSPNMLGDTIDSILDDPAFKGSIWGVSITDLSTGERLYARNADKNFIPASNVKLYTVAAALDQLGPDYRYQTRVYVDGPVEDGVLRGNVIVRGAGDPSLGGYDAPDPLETFRNWADSLKALGVRRIEGDIIGDDDIFSDERLGAGWTWDDLQYSYASEIGGLAFHENMVDVTIRGQEVGQPGTVDWAPLRTDYVNVVNRTRTIRRYQRKDEEYSRLPGTNTLILESLVPSGKIETEELAVHNPTRYFAHVMQEVLLREGISIGGAPVDVDDISIKPDYTSNRLRRVATHTSAPLSDIVKTLNQESLNLYAEHLLRTLAVEMPSPPPDLEPGSGELGAQAVKNTIARAGVDTAFVEFADGSGLSRLNFVSPEATVALLSYMHNHPQPGVWNAFYASLPTGGVNGTLRYRYQNGASANGRVRAKTGTLSSISALSGYVSTGNGRLVAFSIFSNHFTGKSRVARSAQDRLVNALADLAL